MTRREALRLVAAALVPGAAVAVEAPPPPARRAWPGSWMVESDVATFGGDWVRRLVVMRPLLPGAPTLRWAHRNPVGYRTVATDHVVTEDVFNPSQSRIVSTIHAVRTQRRAPPGAA